MLSHDELRRVCQRLGLSNQAQAVIEEIRSAPPARRVRSAAGNVSVRYPSRKMGVIIQAESHRNELAGVYEKEHDRDTLEYYDQPPPIKLAYQAKSGRPVGVLHTPDYFVIRTDAVGWEEWKTEEGLVRLVDQMPHRYVQGADGRWRCPPGERYAEPLGFFYRVRSSAEIDWIFQRNLLFLEDYLRADCPPVGAEATQAVLTLVAAEPGLPLAELLRRAARTSSDDIYTLIATAQVYVDIRAAPLAEPERVGVFRDAETARAYAVMVESARRQALGPVSRAAIPGPGLVHVAAGASVAWDGRGWTIVNVGETTTALLAGDGTLAELPHPIFAALVQQGKLTGLPEPAPSGIRVAARDLLARASPDDLQEANRRYAIIAPRLAGHPADDDPTPARTVRDWLAKWRAAEQLHGCGYVGLLPRRWASGNRERKLPASTLAALDEFIAHDYETLKQQPKYEVHGLLLRACEERGILAPSYKTFAQAVDQRPRQAQVEKRQGRRAAYQQAPFYWELALTTPRHGDRPFEIGHIDHTQLDIELRCSRTGRNLGRPWATFLTDTFSRRLPAVYLAFDPPSYRACMMIVRECVRRHGRLPQIIVVDGGPEFGSIYFETLLARYECTKKTRPGAQARFGSVCERLFGTTNTRFVHNLVGNTQITRAVRQVTQAVDPQEHARWTLGRLYERLCEWAYEVYDTIEHPALGQSPRDAWTAGLAQGGQRPQRLIPYDEDFRMLTLPTTPKGMAQVQPRLGVKIHYLHYWSDAFLDPEVEHTAVPVRFDPFDAGTAYAFVKGRWVRCISEHYARFAGHSEREMMLATAELRRGHQRHTQQSPITARKLADFLTSLAAEEALLEQRLRDTEARDVLALIEGDRRPEPGPALLVSGAPRLAGDRAAPGRAPSRSADVPSSSDTLVLYEEY
ncbi:MAG: DDE-type integrase/transposase/recombinase [Chloroflexi bacterium]|nr:DDE-type integrase/transposase/recombinase [Chloroflexota bacterium]